MTRIQRLFVALVGFVGIATTIVNAQNLPPNFGTPQGTNALAASDGFIDILGIKLGMPAEEALAKLKANYPAAKITLQRTADYESVWHRLERENPSHKWVSEIDVEPPNGEGDKILIGLSLPPSKQVVQSIARDSYFKEPVAVENIFANLRKKYGQETYGVDYRLGPVAAFDGSEKHLLWVYDPLGNRVKPDAVSRNATTCLGQITGDMGGAQISLGSRPYDRTTLNINPCWSFVILTASIQMVSATQGLTGQAQGFQVIAYDWPLMTSGANALYSFLDQGARDVAAKQAADAKKRGGDVKY
jgi:hypothetical protein